MYSRSYKAAVGVPPLVWVGLFLLLPYALLFAYSFWGVSNGVIVHRWNLGNYAELWRNPMYLEVLLRSMKIAGSVTLVAVARLESTCFTSS